MKRFLSWTLIFLLFSTASAFYDTDDKDKLIPISNDLDHVYNEYILSLILGDQNNIDKKDDLRSIADGEENIDDEDLLLIATIFDEQDNTDEKEKLSLISESQIDSDLTTLEVNRDCLSSHNFLILLRNQGNSIYSKGGYTTVGLFSFPFERKRIHPFFDLRFHHFHKNENAFSAGVGVRFDSTCTCHIFGINAYYDCRTACNSAYHQFGLGLESLGRCWNFRLNGYLPLGNKSHRCSFCYFDDYIGDFFFIHEKFRDSLKGVNFEIERVIRGCNKEISLAIAPYYYNIRKGCQRDIYGSQIRLSARYCNYFVFSVLASYDNVFKGRIQGQIGLVLPLYFNNKQRSADYLNPLYQPVQRNDAIILKSRNRWIWNF